MRDRTVRAWTRDVFEDAQTKAMADTAWLVGLGPSILDHRVVAQTDTLHLFSHTLTPKMRASDQGQTGKCWAFAGLGLLRRRIAAAYRLKDADAFELSHTYLLFFDKLEKAHAFLRRVVETRHRPHGDRWVDWLMEDPVADGGTWNTFETLVNKYGIVPDTVMPPSGPSEDTASMTQMLDVLLHQSAHRLREGSVDPEAEIDDVMRRVHRLLCITLGAPPERSTWTYESTEERNGDDTTPSRLQTGRVRRSEEMTPLEFFRACRLSDDDLVTLVHVPSSDGRMRRGHAYTVAFAETVWEAAPSVYHNVSLSDFLGAAHRTLRDGQMPVWFACESHHHHLPSRGLVHHDLVQHARAIGEDLERDKRRRVDARSVHIDHAMLLTGSHEEEQPQVSSSYGRPQPVVTRWQAENSHGGTIEGGYLSITTSWMARHAFQVVVPRRFVQTPLPTKVQPPLAPWDGVVVGVCRPKNDNLLGNTTLP